MIWTSPVRRRTQIAIALAALIVGGQIGWVAATSIDAHPEEGLRLEVRNAILEALDTDDPVRRAKLVAEAANKANELDFLRSSARRYVVVGQLSLADLEGARATAASIGDDGERSLAILAIDATAAGADDLERALNEALTLHDMETVVQVLTRVALAQVRSGDRATARRTFVMARDTIHATARIFFLKLVHDPWKAIVDALADIFGLETSPGPDKPSAGRLLAAIGKRQVEAGLLDDAIQTAEAIDDATLRAGVLLHRDESVPRIVRTYLERSEFAGAISVARAMNDDKKRRKLIARIGDRISKATGTRDVDELRKAGRAAVLVSSEDERAELLKAIAAAQATAGDVEAAMESAAAIPATRSDDLDTAYMAIAFAQMKADDLDEAAETTGRISDPATYAMTMAVVAELQAHDGDSAAARESFSLARDALGRIPSHNRGLVAGLVEGHFKDAFPGE